MQQAFFEIEEQSRLARHSHSLQPLRRDVHVEHIGIGTKRIAYLQLLSFLLSDEDNTRVGLFRYIEDEVCQAKVLLLEW